MTDFDYDFITFLSLFTALEYVYLQKWVKSISGNLIIFNEIDSLPSYDPVCGHT